MMTQMLWYLTCWELDHVIEHLSLNKMKIKKFIKINKIHFLTALEIRTLRP